MGVIDSFKGKGGGITLSTYPEKVNIGLLVKELEMDSILVECFGDNGHCRINLSCKLKMALQKAQRSFYQTLEEYTLADLITNKAKLSHSLGLEV